MSSSLFFFFAHQSATLWYCFTQLCHSLLKNFPLFFSLFHKSSDLWIYLPHLLSITLNNLVLVSISPLNSTLKLYLRFILLFMLFTKLCLPEPINIFLGIFVCHLGNVDVSRYTETLVFIRKSIKHKWLNCMFCFFIFFFDLIELQVNIVYLVEPNLQISACVFNPAQVPPIDNLI